MPDSRRLPLRVLYTINSSPQYILARSVGSVAVVPINDTADSHMYCTVSFKTCLETICRSSPELVHDNSRDFSVYVLDPLESNSAPAPMDISNGRTTQPLRDSTINHPRGVAVGMGLMSWALSTGESEVMSVVGTFARTGAGQEAVEVIFALRETILASNRRSHISSHSRALPQDDGHNWLHSTPSSSVTSTTSLLSSQANAASLCSTTLATIASIQMRTKTKQKPKKAPRISTTPITESDKLMSADTYIGPLKKKGRPKGPSTTDVKIKTEEAILLLPQQRVVGSSTGILPNPIEASGVITSLQSPIADTESSLAPLQTSGSLAIRDESDAKSLTAVVSATHNEAAQNAALMTALRLIDSPANLNELQTTVNPALVDALRQILTTAYANARIRDSSLSQPPTCSAQASLSNNEDIGLDKENVNPTVSLRQSTREYEEAKLAGNPTHPGNTTIESPAIQQSERPIQNRGLGARSVENSPPKSRPAATADSVSSNSLRRKRTLSEFMDEKDNNRSHRNKNKLKDKERSDRKETSRSIYNQQHHSYENGLRHYPRILASTLPLPEPGINSYYRAPLDAKSSPPRPSRTSDVKSRSIDPLGGTSRYRPIIIPDSPQAPRVSASSPIRPSNRSKKPYTVPEWARTNTATQPRLSEDAQRAIEIAEQKKKQERQLNRRKSNAAAQERARLRGRLAGAQDIGGSSSELVPPEKSKQAPPKPVLATGDLLPVVASTTTSSILLLSPSRRSPSPTLRLPLITPMTPRHPSRFAPSTPRPTGCEEDPLFTPVSVHQDGIAGLPLSPGTFGSPLLRKKPRISSPIFDNKQLDSECSIITTLGSRRCPDGPHRSKHKDLHDELDDATDDLDCPPSSLPIASSDIDVDDTISYNSTDTKAEEAGDVEHWIGLPPSSPPPMSPGLMPVDDLDATDLPFASETDEGDIESWDNTTPNMTESDWALSPGDDLTASTNTPSAHANQDVVDDLAFFRQYTSSVSSGLEGHPSAGSDSNALFPDDLAANLNFSEFWESFKPLVQQGTTNTAEQTFDFNLDGTRDGVVSISSELDHSKLAEDMQTLFSGCLV